MDLFAQAHGIDHVFGAKNATLQDTQDAALGAERPAVHPFRFYPVADCHREGAAAPRSHRIMRRGRSCSLFVGARANSHYPRKTRNFILDLLGNDPRGLITGRLTWFYNKIVYDHQIHRKAGSGPPESLVRTGSGGAVPGGAGTEHFFSLCPLQEPGPIRSGCGKSIGAGGDPG